MRKALVNGCLVLLMIPAVLMVYFWYTLWHAENENDRRQRAASDSLLRQARDATDRTADVLDGSGDTGTDAVLGVIWKHTGSPVISYDEERRVFTAVALRTAEYEQESVVLVMGPGRVERCFVHTFRRRPGPAWTSQVTERNVGACRESRDIGNSVRYARSRTGDMDAARMTRADVQRVLDPLDPLSGERRIDVRSVVREGRRVVAVVLFRDRYRVPEETSAPIEQCYRLTRVLGIEGGTVQPVTAVPVAAC
ncbi:hypothetical protein ACFUN7_11200 [Streptomyces sp. NPDC057236]|uniref:hypothetical protein n=1 Tax=Streptomyces sp. NPDC057236 TaxID=3346059 RepID=UPI003631493A